MILIVAAVFIMVFFRGGVCVCVMTGIDIALYLFGICDGSNKVRCSVPSLKEENFKIRKFFVFIYVPIVMSAVTAWVLSALNYSFHALIIELCVFFIFSERNLWTCVIYITYALSIRV